MSLFDITQKLNFQKLVVHLHVGVSAPFEVRSFDLFMCPSVRVSVHVTLCVWLSAAPSHSLPNSSSARPSVHSLSLKI